MRPVSTSHAQRSLTCTRCPALLQASINATTLALISAGLPLSDYVCALSLASYPSISPTAPAQIPPFETTTQSVPHSNKDTGTVGSGSTTILDLCQAEEQALPCLTVAVLPRSSKVTLVSLETRVGVGRFEEMLRWGVEGSKVVQAAMEDVSCSRLGVRRGLGVLTISVNCCSACGCGHRTLPPRQRTSARCSRAWLEGSPRARTTWTSDAARSAVNVCGVTGSLEHFPSGCAKSLSDDMCSARPGDGRWVVTDATLDYCGE